MIRYVAVNCHTNIAYNKENFCNKVVGTNIKRPWFLFPILLPANAPGKPAVDGPSAWPCTHVGDRAELPGPSFGLVQFCLWLLGDLGSELTGGRSLCNSAFRIIFFKETSFWKQLLYNKPNKIVCYILYQLFSVVFFIHWVTKCKTQTSPRLLTTLVACTRIVD